MTVLGYDLLLLDSLRRRVRSAVTQLAAIRSDDPLATAAIHS